MTRCEHNCLLCKNENLGRCLNSGEDVSLKDTPVCKDYIYWGSSLHLKEIIYAESLGIKELNEEQLAIVKEEYNREIKEGIRDKDGLTEQEYLASYRPSNYEKPSVTVDMLVFGMNHNFSNLKVLLIQRGGHPYLNSWALPGGFVAMNESCYESAQRELEEETGLKDVYMEQLYTFSNPKRDPRMRVIDVAYMTLLKTIPVANAGDDAKDALWFDVNLSDNELVLRNEERGISICYHLDKKEFTNGIISTLGYVPRLEKSTKIVKGKEVEVKSGLAFDHVEILLEGLLRLRNKIEYTDLAFNLVPDEFTLSDLQMVYEVVGGVKLYKKNFRDKIKNQVESLNKKGKSIVGNKSAELYRYKKEGK